MRYIKISNTDTGIAPFDGVILDSNMRDNVGKVVNIKKLIKKYRNNHLIGGIVFNGDWDRRPLEFIDVLKELKDSNLGVVINTHLSMEEFKLSVGIASHNKIHDTNMKMNEVSDIDIPMLVFIGSMLIDYYLGYTDYYFRYKENGEYNLCKIALPKEDEDGEEL